MNRDSAYETEGCKRLLAARTANLVVLLYCHLFNAIPPGCVFAVCIAHRAWSAMGVASLAKRRPRLAAWS